MTNSVIISDIVIHQDGEGRYSVNDLHKAAGNERRHEPKNWLNIQQTAELIEEIKNTGISVITPIHTQRGCKGGTYVCKELVYAYAMWVSAAFALKVIRAYDALVTSQNEKAAAIAKTSVDDRTPLRDAVNLLVSKRALPYDEAYSIIHQRFGVHSIEELEPENLPAAIEYVHRLALEGELLPKQQNAMPVLPVFPLGTDFKFITSVDGGSVTEMRVLRPGEYVTTVQDFIHMMRATGWLVEPASELARMNSLALAQLIKNAEQRQIQAF